MHVHRHCEELLRRLVRRSPTGEGGSNPFFLYAEKWIASRSPSSGAHTRDPLARNDGLYDRAMPSTSSPGSTGDDGGGDLQPSRQTEYFLACQGPPDRPEKSWKQETPAENDLTIKGRAYIAGIYEHPTRHAPDKSTAQLHAEVAKGAIEDAGLT
jgi:hypothetical protein